jgi:hypothetical protein
MNDRAFWDFRNEIRIKKLPEEKQEERKVWKFKGDWNKKRKTDKK